MAVPKCAPQLVECFPEFRIERASLAFAALLGSERWQERRRRRPCARWCGFALASLRSRRRETVRVVVTQVDIMASPPPTAPRPPPPPPARRLLLIMTISLGGDRSGTLHVWEGDDPTALATVRRRALAAPRAGSRCHRVMAAAVVLCVARPRGRARARAPYATHHPQHRPRGCVRACVRACVCVCVARTRAHAVARRAQRSTRARAPRRRRPCPCHRRRSRSSPWMCETRHRRRRLRRLR